MFGQTRFAIEFQGGLIQTALRYGKQTQAQRVKKDTAKRGGIGGFSRKSRNRLMKKMARLAFPKKGAKPKLITLTYPKYYPDTKTAKKHLRAFLERLRRMCPKSSAMVRLEYQKRGAPHFHLIVYGLPYLDKETLQAWWGDIIGHEKPFTRIEVIKSRRGVMSYVSKYVAKVHKVQRVTCQETGEIRYEVHDKKYSPKTKRYEDDIWVVDESIWRVEPATGGTGFNLVPYLHAGRWWQVFNADYLPWAAKKVVEVYGDFWKVYWHLRRASRKQYKGLAKKICVTPSGVLGAGWSLFTEQPEKWEAYLRYLTEQYPLPKRDFPMMLVTTEG